MWSRFCGDTPVVGVHEEEETQCRLLGRFGGIIARFGECSSHSLSWGLLSVHLATAVSADTTVNIMTFKFDPTPPVIPVGTTVVWTNQDTAPHTATSDPGSAFAFDTGKLQKGQSGKITFTQVGTFTYFCSIHPNMHASVVVTAAGATLPAVPPRTGGGGESSESFFIHRLGDG